ncbi:MAG TPA: Zn-dependent hydrolase, partial [Terriglobales bacterium]|nr:Zn-dependent hydrolase [Terriglobales bacterium]
QGERFPFAIEVVGFSEEEGVRFGTPFIGSRALVGKVDQELLERKDRHGLSVRAAIQDFGLNPGEIADACLKEDVLGYIEFHIEQGPVLDDLGLPLAAVEAIVGQSRHEVTFIGRENHAGTTPMHLRQDALAGAAEWITTVEREGNCVAGLVATVGAVNAKPGTANVIPGQAQLTLDVRHAVDAVRLAAVDNLIRMGAELAVRRQLSMRHRTLLNQPPVAMNSVFLDCMEEAIRRAGCKPHRMVSGAGHDAMVLAEQIPTAMMFVRTPEGISHHPNETVNFKDVEKALEAGLNLLDVLASAAILQRHKIKRA